MIQRLKIDFVSDIMCPWCAVGLGGLETALKRLGDKVEADVTFHPFELNPDMLPEGEIQLDHIMSKYGMSADQAHQGREHIRKLAANVGFVINRDDETRIYNTFDAHRLLAWAKEKAKQYQLKKALLAAYFTDLKKLSDLEVLVAAAEAVGLDGHEARNILTSQKYADQVREEEAVWRRNGVTSVPTIVVNDRYVISGGKPPEEFERQLREILAA